MTSEAMEVETIQPEVEESFDQLESKETSVVETLISKMESASENSTDSILSCRICKCNGGSDLVASPCHCKGSMGIVHVSCLEEWLTGSIRDSCELCSFPFNVVRTRKFGCVKSIWFFLQNHVRPIKLFRDLFFLSVSLMNTSILLYMWLNYVFKDLTSLLVSDIKHYSENEQIMYANPLKTVIYFFFFTLCLVFVLVNAIDDFRRIFYFYFLPWYHWWQISVDVKLVLEENIEEKKIA